MFSIVLGAFLALAAPIFVHSTPTATSNNPQDLVVRDGPGSVVTNPAGLLWYNPILQKGATPRTNLTEYVCYSGPASNFPNMSAWISFEDMWKLQKEYALIPIGDNATEIYDMHVAIRQVSVAAKVDARVILAVIIHESTGNVRVQCTYSYGGVHNCGLMQSYNATDTSYDPKHALKSITQMIVDGTQGTASGPGLVQDFNDAPDTNRETNGNVYAVFRAYNSGSVNAENLSDGEGANPAYVSDMANYLQGWIGYGSGSATCNFSTPTTSSPTCASGAFVPPPTQTVTGTTSDCCEYYIVQSGDSCYTVDLAYNITFPELRAWNTYIDADCDNLYADYAYCVDSNITVPSTTSTTTTATPTSTGPAACVSSNYVPAPTQTVTGTTPDCCEWVVVGSGDSCYTIDTEYDITLAQFRAWNTYIDADCDNLYADYAYCVDSNDPVPTTTTSATVTSTSTTQQAATARAATRRRI